MIRFYHPVPEGLGTAAFRDVGFLPDNLVDLTNLAIAFQPLNGNLTAIALLAPADGSLLLRSGATWVALAPGAETTVMTMGATLPAWA